MRDLSRKFTGETKIGRGPLDPAANAVFRRNGVKRRIHFNGGEIVGVKFQPASLRQIRRVENATPVFKAPRARANAYLLLIGQIQNEIAKLAGVVSLEKVFTSGKMAIFQHCREAAET